MNRRARLKPGVYLERRRWTTTSAGMCKLKSEKENCRIADSLFFTPMPRGRIRQRFGQNFTPELRETRYHFLDGLLSQAPTIEVMYKRFIHVSTASRIFGDARLFMVVDVMPGSRCWPGGRHLVDSQAMPMSRMDSGVSPAFLVTPAGI